MYNIEFSKTSEKQFDKLEKNIQKRVVSTLERCRIRPYAYVKKLVDCPYYRLRVGDYRVIMNIKDDELRILVIEIGHRKNIYKR